MPSLRLRTVRRSVALTDELERPVAEVTDDEVSVMDGRRVASRFREVEVELAAGTSDEVLHGLVERLHAAGGGPVDNVSKLRRALGPRAERPPELVVTQIEKVASDGRRFVLSEQTGLCTVVYFFPRAFTVGCTAEAEHFRDNRAELV